MNSAQARGRAAEALLGAVVAFGPLAFGATETWSLAILESAMFALAAWCLWNGWDAGDNPATKRLLPAVAALAALSVVQWTNPASALAPQPLLPATASVDATRRAALLWAAYAAFLWASAVVLSRPGALIRLVRVVFGLGLFVSIVGIIQRGQGDTAYYGLRTVQLGHPFGPYANYNHAACLLLMSASCGAGLLADRLAGRKDWSSPGHAADSLAKSVLLAFLVVTVVAGILVAGSRGALNALVATACAVTFAASVRGAVSRRSARILLAFGGLLVVGYGSFIASHPQVVGALWGKIDISTAYRLSMFRSSLKMVLDRPLWGSGMGTVWAAFAPYHEFWENYYSVDHVHCDWLELVVQAGVVGAAIAGTALALYLRGVRAAWARLPRPDFVRWGAAAGVFAFAVHSLVEFNFQIPADAVCLLALTSALGVRARAEGGARAASRPEPLRMAACAAAIALAASALAPLPAAAILFRAEGQPAERRLPLLRRALLLDDSPQARVRVAAALRSSPAGSPESRVANLREALGLATEACRAEEANPFYCGLRSTLLTDLGRAPDPRVIWPQAR